MMDSVLLSLAPMSILMGFSLSFGLGVAGCLMCAVVRVFKGLIT